MKIPFVDRFMGGRSEHPDYGMEESADLNRYAGRWYEIAAFPAWFDAGCRNGMEESVYMDDYFEVKNVLSREAGLSVKSVSPRPLGVSDTQMRVRFIWPFRSNYWICALDESCRYAMVGHPEKKYLWIISRTPHMDDYAYKAFVKQALLCEPHEKPNQSCLPGLEFSLAFRGSCSRCP